MGTSEDLCSFLTTNLACAEGAEEGLDLTRLWVLVGTFFFATISAPEKGADGFSFWVPSTSNTADRKSGSDKS
jgi:hypothetical protein